MSLTQSAERAAGGRRYLHINAAGDVEPCVFIHYPNANIHDVSLLDALRSPLFMKYYEGQPFNDNYLKPCPMLENPDVLPRMVPKPTASGTTSQILCTPSVIKIRHRAWLNPTCINSSVRAVFSNPPASVMQQIVGQTGPTRLPNFNLPLEPSLKTAKTVHGKFVGHF